VLYIILYYTSCNLHSYSPLLNLLHQGFQGNLASVIMSRVRGDELPTLQNIEPGEVRLIKDMFTYLCGVDNTGKIPSNMALKLFISLGLEISEEALPHYLTFKDFLLYADAAVPEDTPEGHAKTMNCMISQQPDGSIGDVRPENIIEFSKRLQRPLPSEREAELYITSLTDYDDCEGEVMVSKEVFQRELVKQYNAMELSEELSVV
jgi:hypothetical protein